MHSAFRILVDDNEHDEYKNGLYDTKMTSYNINYSIEELPFYPIYVSVWHNYFLVQLQIVDKNKNARGTPKTSYNFILTEN